MKPAKIIINVFSVIVMLFFFIQMFFNLEKNILYYIAMNAIWLISNIEKYYESIVEEKPNFNKSQRILAKTPYFISIICLVMIVILEFSFFTEIRHAASLTVTAINALSLFYGYFLLNHLNKVAMA